MARTTTPPGQHQLRAGQMVVLFPYAATPEDQEPFIAARSRDGRWCVVVHLRLSDRGTFYQRDLEVTPWDDIYTPMSTQVLRQLPLGQWLTDAHAWIAQRAQTRMQEGQVSRELQRLASSRKAPRTGRRPTPQWNHRRLALEYLKLQEKGVGRGIRRELAVIESRHQRRPVTDSMVLSALVQATHKGFLGPGTRGRAGRAPGPNLFVEEEGK
ncbi:MAG: hypothetical protein M0014_16130 [Actinomycetota bacterium]|nr:hypothetical protein [Actinomycetota bacterium]